MFHHISATAIESIDIISQIDKTSSDILCDLCDKILDKLRKGLMKNGRHVNPVSSYLIAYFNQTIKKLLFYEFLQNFIFGSLECYSCSQQFCLPLLREILFHLMVFMFPSHYLIYKLVIYLYTVKYFYTT